MKTDQDSSKRKSFAAGASRSPEIHKNYWCNFWDKYLAYFLVNGGDTVKDH